MVCPLPGLGLPEAGPFRTASPPGEALDNGGRLVLILHRSEELIYIYNIYIYITSMTIPKEEEEWRKRPS